MGVSSRNETGTIPVTKFDARDEGMICYDQRRSLSVKLYCEGFGAAKATLPGS